MRNLKSIGKNHKKLLDMVEEGKSIKDIEQNVKKIYHELYYKLNERNNKISYRYTPEEIDFFRKYDTVGFNYYMYIYDTIYKFKPIQETFDEIFNTLVNSKVSLLLEKVIKSIDLLEKLLESKNVSELNNFFDDIGKKRHITYNDDSNWKYRIYTIRLDDNLSSYTIIREELDEIMKYVATFHAHIKISFNKNSYFTKIGEAYKKVENIINLHMDKIKKMEEKTSEFTKDEKKNLQLNDDLLSRDDIRYLYEMLKLMYKYQQYCIWSRNRLKSYSISSKS